MLQRSAALEARQRIGLALDQARRCKRWSQSELAKRTGYDEKTIRNVLSGAGARDRTIGDICQALDVNPAHFDDMQPLSVWNAADYGGYSYLSHGNYAGYYLLYRFAFQSEDKIFRTVVKIHWSDAESCLRFSEYFDSEKAQNESYSGPVCFSAYTNLLHFVTIYQGSVRLITGLKMREAERIIRGSILTQSDSVTCFLPTHCPVFLQKVAEHSDEFDFKDKIGLLDVCHDQFAFAQDQLQTIATRVIKNICVS
ncbi:XRE family transcriptional regulator [Jiella endophytica]|uniref:XRE family transcriptional regulator n=1 Tax=Jiella endophytica TaxID=2558362 RepID=A0A4Y8RTL2_9HYPH|nr:helix-turn-helix transcriptional regulator [Jiella endophytica]TFF27640.1 XRE family transcriptional regulator [Jiella endophytica]